jgi:RNA polymerase sigma-70 factor (ECF subfamily)
MRQRNPPAEPATFEDLYAEHAPRVESLLWWLRVATRELADVAQEVWIDVHQRLATYDPAQGTERAWLAGIARNAARDWHRSQRRRPERSTFTDQEPAELRTSETEALDEQQREALWAFLLRAVPNADQREAFVLHEVGGLTVGEVAKETGVRLWTAQWRIKMARGKLKAAQEALTDEEREKLRAVVPLVSIDALIQAMRSPVSSDREIARVWDRVSAQIEREGGSIHTPLGSPVSALPPLAAPSGYMLSGAEIAGGIAGAFVVGVLTGAGTLHAFAPRGRTGETSIAMIDESRQPAPSSTPTPEPAPGPAPSASAAPSATSSAAAAAWESEALLLDRARAALVLLPQQALALANEHARRFPDSNAAEREEVAIRALLQLGQRAAAEERAARLLVWAPFKRPAMESLLGRPIF